MKPPRLKGCSWPILVVCVERPAAALRFGIVVVPKARRMVCFLCIAPVVLRTCQRTGVRHLVHQSDVGSLICLFHCFSFYLFVVFRTSRRTLRTLRAQRTPIFLEIRSVPITPRRDKSGWLFHHHLHAIHEVNAGGKSHRLRVARLQTHRRHDLTAQVTDAGMHGRCGSDGQPSAVGGQHEAVG